MNLFWSWLAIVGIVIAVLSGGCSRAKGPADVALDYARALYACDAASIHALVPARDRATKDEASVAAQLRRPNGFAQEARTNWLGSSRQRRSTHGWPATTRGSP